MTAPRRSVPEITIGVPVFNGARYLRSALDALLGQTFGDFELLIADNASVDATAEICAEAARRDQRIRYLRHVSNIGGPRNWSFVARQATGKYFKWASANDLHDPEFLAKCRAALEADANAVLCYSDTIFIDENANPLSAFEDPLQAADADPVTRFKCLLATLAWNNAQAGVIRTAALRRTGLEGPYAGSDVPLMAELALHGRLIRVPERLFFRRLVRGATTAFADSRELRAFYATSPRGPDWSLWRKNIDLARAVLRAPLAFSDRLRALGHVARLMKWERAKLWAEAKRAVALGHRT